MSSSYAAEAALALQGAIVTAAKASAAVKAVLGSAVRLYDRVPAEPTWPYASFGPIQALDGGTQCEAGAEVFIQIDVWSRAVGRVEAMRAAAPLATLLDDEITVPGHEVIVHEMRYVLIQTGRDGLTTQAIIRLRYELAPSS
jgi:hypothetical protein